MCRREGMPEQFQHVRMVSASRQEVGRVHLCSMGSSVQRVLQLCIYLREDVPEMWPSQPPMEMAHTT